MRDHLKFPCDPNFTPRSCGGEICICGKPAQRKIEEVIFDDDPHGWQEDTNAWAQHGFRHKGEKILARHPLTSYLCLDCFKRIMGVKD